MGRKDCCQTPPDSIGRKQADKMTQVQTSAAFHEKGRMTKRVESSVHRAEPKTLRIILRSRNLIRTIPSNICPAEYQNCYAIVSPLSPLPILNGNVYSCYPTPVLPFYVGVCEADNLFLVLQIDRLKRTIFMELYPRLDLIYLYEEILDVELIL